MDLAAGDDDVLDLAQLTDDRYARLRLINWWQQERLAAARIMVVGAGALGNEVLKNLALLGVGHIVVVDRDTIERSNLSRTVLFRVTDLGRAKAEVAAEQIERMNPDVQAMALIGDITNGIGLGVFRRMDVVISCLDNRLARRAVNRACWRVRVPWVDGGIEALDGLMRVFSSADPETACYECTLSDRDYELLGLVYSCPVPTAFLDDGLYPTTPTAAAIIGAMQTQEAIKVLHGLPVRAGAVSYFSGEALHMTRMQYAYKADCPAHQRYDPVITLDGASAQMTGDELITAIARQIGETGVPVLLRPIVTQLRCPQCRHVEDRYRPQVDQAQLGIPCAQCGTQYEFGIAYAIRPGTKEASLPLMQLGIPPLAIVNVRSRANEYFVELTGDAVDLLQ